MALLNNISLADAFRRGHQAWKCNLSYWGDLGTNEDATSRGYDIERPVYGCQIAHDSDVGECFVNYFGGDVNELKNDYAVNDRRLYIRRGKSYHWRTPAPISINPTYETVYEDRFVPSNPLQSQDFGDALDRWYNTVLRVIFFLQPVPLPIKVPEQPYEPYPMSYPGGYGYLALDTNAEYFNGQMVRMIQHASQVRLQFWGAPQQNEVGQMTEVRICGVGGRSTDFLGTLVLREFDLLSSPVIFGGRPDDETPYASLVIKNPNATWLTIYPRKLVGDLDVFFRYSLIAD